MRSSRHTELAGFLMSRRTRLLPESCGLPRFQRRRRTPGLRREEVSALAGISTAYYTWIEQGRMFDVSIEVLDAIAGALQLNEIEAAHLFTLAGKTTPRPPLAVTGGVATWQGAIVQLVRLFDHGPAFVLTPCLDISEANHVARATLGVGAGANFAETFFCGDAAVRYHRADALSGALVSLLRRNHAQDTENGHFNGIVETLRRRSDAFKTLWDGHVVDKAPLFDVEIERANAVKASFHGVIVSDPIAARQFALFMSRSAEIADRKNTGPVES
jgi:transcriptional regulator with XRE-family HTH domain